MTKVALDIDDVLAGYVMGVHEVFDSELIPHDHWQIDGPTGMFLLKLDQENKVVGYTQKYLDKCEHNKDFWYGLEPIMLPCNVPKETVCYITSSPKNMVDVRMEWLKKHGYPRLPVIHSKNKSLTMERLKVDLLIDDKMSTVQEVRTHKKLNAIHFKPWYSTVYEKASSYYIRDWKYCLTMLKKEVNLQPSKN